MNRNPSKLISLARIFRLEYSTSLIPWLLITFFLCAKRFGEFLSIEIFEVSVAYSLLVFSGFGANSVADREIDSKYTSGKRNISLAVSEIGVKNSWMVIFLMFFIALLLTIHISVSFESWFPLILVIVSCFFGYGYSIPPLQFKVRGLTLHAVSLIVSVVLLFPVLSTFVYLGAVSGSRMVFFVGCGLTIYGLSYCNQAMDYLEDKEDGVQTPAVRMGVTKTLKAALIVTTIGIFVAFVGIYRLFLESWQNAGDGLSQYYLYLPAALAGLVLFAGYFMPLRKTWKLYRLSTIETPEIFVPKISALCHYPSWQAAGIVGISAATAIYYTTTNFVW